MFINDGVRSIPDSPSEADLVLEPCVRHLFFRVWCESSSEGAKDLLRSTAGWGNAGIRPTNVFVLGDFLGVVTLLRGLSRDILMLCLVNISLFWVSNSSSSLMAQAPCS